MLSGTAILSEPYCKHSGMDMSVQVQGIFSFKSLLMKVLYISPYTPMPSPSLLPKGS